MGSYICRSAPCAVPSLGHEERAHLLLLGATAGCPSIIADAVDSGDIFDPRHMKKALAMQAEWEHGTEILKKYLADRRRNGFHPCTSKMVNAESTRAEN